MNHEEHRIFDRAGKEMVTEQAAAGAAPRLRRLRASDLEAIYQLDQICFARGIAYSRAELRGYFRRQDTQFWVAETGPEPAPQSVPNPGLEPPSEFRSTIAGFVAASCDRRERGHIITLDVAPAWRRRALGTMLMDTAEGWIGAQGGKAVYLEAAVDNLAALSFYERRGYAKLGRLEGYYGKGDAAWRMGKWLKLEGVQMSASHPNKAAPAAITV